MKSRVGYFTVYYSKALHNKYLFHHIYSIAHSLLLGASLAQDRGRMEARIEALTAEVRELNKECQVTNVSNNKRLLCNTGSVDLSLLSPSCSELVYIVVTGRFS